MLCLVQVAAGGPAGRDRRPGRRRHAALLGGRRRRRPRDRGPCRPRRNGVLPASRRPAAGAAVRRADRRRAGRASNIRPASARWSQKILGQSSAKHETRTDWRQRPLSKRQIEYALEDALHLQPLCDRLQARLGELGRLAWMDEEMADWKEELRRAVPQERWRRVSGNAGLDARSLAIVRELWKWREAEARRRDQPARRVLRDDLIVELARRQTADVEADPRRAGHGAGRPAAAGGRDRGLRSSGRWRCRRSSVRRGRRASRRRNSPCWASSSSPPWAASAARPNLRPTWWAGPTTSASLIAYRTSHGRPRDRRAAAAGPRLARASSSAACSRTCLAGKVAIRVADPQSDHPLVFE